jgi:predicted small lipoprotein YifL
MIRDAKKLTLLLVLAAFAASCGVKNDLVPPDSKPAPQYGKHDKHDKHDKTDPSRPPSPIGE